MTRPSIKRRVLFLYEGDTEDEFFPLVFQKYLVGSRIEIHKQNLEGDFNINKKVANAIYTYLSRHRDIKSLYVVVQHDRDGKRNEKETDLDIEGIKKVLANRKELKSIHDLLLTQMLESLFFIDIEGIYVFLQTPKTKRKPEHFRNHENFNATDLKHLIQRLTKNQKTYVKGKQAKSLIKSLDIEKIYYGCEELQRVIEFILKGK